MGSSMDSRYWVCPSCFKQFDWLNNPKETEEHDPKKCKQNAGKENSKLRDKIKPNT